MKIIYVMAIAFLLLLLSACARKVNDPDDIQAIKEASAAWDKAWNAGNVESLLALYTDEAVAMPPNQPLSVGKEAMRTANQKYFDQFREDNRSIVEDVRVSGDLAIARGTQVTITTPKAGGKTVQDKAKWISAFQRQPNGSWKVLWEMYNSDLPCCAK
jgi:uncharacterized protein (TIGR02246 family)